MKETLKYYEKQIPKISDLRIFISNTIANPEVRFKVAKSLFMAEKAASFGSFLGKKGLLAGFVGGALIGYFSPTMVAPKQEITGEAEKEPTESEESEESESVES